MYAQVIGKRLAAGARAFAYSDDKIVYALFCLFVFAYSALHASLQKISIRMYAHTSIHRSYASVGTQVHARVYTHVCAHVHAHAHTQVFTHHVLTAARTSIVHRFCPRVVITARTSTLMPMHASGQQLHGRDSELAATSLHMPIPLTGCHLYTRAHTPLWLFVAIYTNWSSYNAVIRQNAAPL